MTVAGGTVLGHSRSPLPFRSVFVVVPIAFFFFFPVSRWLVTLYSHFPLEAYGEVIKCLSVHSYSVFLNWLRGTLWTSYRCHRCPFSHSKHQKNRKRVGTMDNGHFNSFRILWKRKQKKSDMTFDKKRKRCPWPFLVKKQASYKTREQP